MVDKEGEGEWGEVGNAREKEGGTEEVADRLGKRGRGDEGKKEERREGRER